MAVPLLVRLSQAGNVQNSDNLAHLVAMGSELGLKFVTMEIRMMAKDACLIVQGFFQDGVALGGQALVLIVVRPYAEIP